MHFKENEMALVEIFTQRTHSLLRDDFFQVPYNDRGARGNEPCATCTLPVLWGNFRYGAGFSGSFQDLTAPRV